jgi:hypothetical protein
MGNASFPGGNVSFPAGKTPFPTGNASFPTGNGSNKQGKSHSLWGMRAAAFQAGLFGLFSSPNELAPPVEDRTVRKTVSEA